ncbi:MAG: hypothetical protein K2W95_05410 [Candidatus Obscuribacterales bacterium]|nr:hypothetical protein [Candidatus Obscuribacterales bacterium]
MSDKDQPAKKRDPQLTGSLSGELRLSASDYDSSERVYEKVRSWYLARLRKAAVEETTRNVNLTPAALIVADREFVERLILEKSNLPKKSSGQVIPQLDYWPILLFTWLAGNALTMVLYCLERHGDVVSTAMLFYSLSVGRLLGEVPPDLSDPTMYPFYVRMFPFFLVGFPIAGAIAIFAASYFLREKPSD